MRHYHAAARPLARYRTTPIAWCLNHVRTLTIEHELKWRMRPSESPPIKPGLLFNLAELLSTPIAARLEELHVAANTDDPGERGWRRLMRRLPPSCHTIALGLSQRVRTAEGAERRILDELPPGVRRLRVSFAPNIELFVDDRLDELVLPFFVAKVAPIAEALARTSRVRLRVGGLRTSVGLSQFGERVVVGDDGAALLRGADAIQVLRPPTLFAQQRRFGLIPIRTQLTRALPERHGFTHSQIGELRVVESREADILRHTDGSFTLRRPRSNWVVSRNGTVVDKKPVPLVDGDRLTIDGTEWLFSATGGGRAL